MSRGSEKATSPHIPMKPFKSLTGVAAVLLGAALCPLEPSFARTARNFDCFEFGVITVGQTITAPALQLYSAKINSEKSDPQPEPGLFAVP